MTYYNYETFPFKYLPINDINRSSFHQRNFLGENWNRNEYFYFKTKQVQIGANIEFLTYDELKEIKLFLLSLKGKFNDFWMPDYVHMLPTINKVILGTQELTVDAKLYNQNLRPIIILFPDYNFITHITTIKRITTDSGEPTITYFMKDPFPYDTNEECVNFCQIYFGRLGKDDIEIKYRNLQTGGTVNINFIENTEAAYKLKLPEIYNTMTYLTD